MIVNLFVNILESAHGNLSTLGNIEKNKTDEKENILYLLNNSVQLNLSTDIINRLNEQLKEIDLQIGLVSFLAERLLTQRDNDIKLAREIAQSTFPNDDGNQSLDAATSANIRIVSGVPQGESEPVEGRENDYSEQLSLIPELAHFGPVFKSSLPVDLTENEVKYVVRCIKHVFSHYIVFQFDISNTLNDQLLEKITVQMDGSAEGFEVVHYTPCPVIKCNDTGTTYTLVKLPDDSSAVTGELACTMKYTVKDCDSTTGEPNDKESYADEFVLEDVKVIVSDHLQKVLKPNWSASWEEIGAENELEDTYTLPLSTLEECMNKIIRNMGMQACERSDKVPEEKASYALYLAGVYRGGHDVLVRAKIALGETSSDPGAQAITMQVTVRSTDQSAVHVIASAVK